MPDAPNVRNTLVDRERDITYHVLAYRELTREEVVASVRIWLAQPKVRRKKLRPGTVVEIVTVFGATPGT